MATLYLFFLVCAGALVMASAVDSRHPFRLNKRQAQADTCLVPFYEDLCTSGPVQDLVDLAVRCNQPTAHIVNGCGRTTNGMLCSAIDTDAIRENAQSAGCDFSSTTCTPDCMTRLMSIRDELDCCFSYYNDSTRDGYDPTLFNNRLWSSCNIMGSTQVCTSTIVVNDIPVDLTCTQSVFQYELFFNIYCRREYIESLIARVSAVQGCEDYVTEGQSVSCNTNRFGTHCDNIIADISDNFTIAKSVCNDTSTCDPPCIDTLNNISMTSGCCFNEEYNDTDTVRYNWLSSEFYSMCGLESSGLCPLGIENATTFRPGTASTNIAPTSTSTTGPSTDLRNTDSSTVPTSAAITISASPIVFTIIALLTLTVR